MPTPSPLDSPHARSGIFALVFAPAALVLLGSSMADVQAQTAIGQPLASVEGLIGMVLAAVLLALVSMNCDESPAGMIVAFAVSIAVGAAQNAGLLAIPILQASSIDGADMSAAVTWSLYPLAVAVVIGGAALALVLASRSTADSPAGAPLRAILEHRHAWVASLALPAAFVAVLLLIRAAPNDTTGVATAGLSALHSPEAGDWLLALAAAGLLGLVALMSPFSLTGPQAASWVLMVLPGYMLLPLWSSITGAVVTPGPSRGTSVALAAPVVAALGLVLGTTTIGVYWARLRALARTTAEGAVGGGIVDGDGAPGPTAEEGGLDESAEPAGAIAGESRLAGE